MGTVMEWGTALEAMAAVFDMEKAATQCLMTLETQATTNADFHLAAFIQENFLRKQVADIKRIVDFLTKMKRVGLVWVSTWWTGTSPPSSTPGKATLRSG